MRGKSADGSQEWGALRFNELPDPAPYIENRVQHSTPWIPKEQILPAPPSNPAYRGSKIAPTDFYEGARSDDT